MMIGYFILSLMIYSRKKYHEDREVRLLTVHLVQFISSTTCGSTRCNYNALRSGVVKFSSCVLSDVIFWWEKSFNYKTLEGVQYSFYPRKRRRDNMFNGIC